jgi:CRISPR/Cas system-associated exonuclease Cas4 (RecB family)
MISEKISKLLKESDERRDKEDSEARKKAVGGFTGASQLGWVSDCPRRLCLMRLCPDKGKEKDEKMKTRLREGKKQEKIIRADLAEAGIELIHTPRLEWPAMELSGELDDLIVVDGEKYPIDYKTCASAMFNKISRAQSKEDLIRSPFSWIRHYPAQLQAYMLMTQRRLSALLFKDKEGGAMRLMDIELDSAYASSLLDGLRYVNECVAKDDPPKAEEKDVCGGCGFADFDFPERQKGAMSGKIEIVTDEDWLLRLKEYQGLVDSGVQKSVKEFKKLEEEIKDEFRGRTAYVGDHFIESKSYFVPYYDVPQEEKLKYQKQREQFRTSIKLIFGKF